VRRVLILGAGPVGLELAGEIREAWPDKHVTILGPSAEILPGYLPEVRVELHRQLEELGIDLRLRSALESLPPVQDGTAAAFTVRTGSGAEIAADIWFRCFGAHPNTGFLCDGALGDLTDRRTVPVDEHWNVPGHPNVYALGDIAELPDPKMATWAQTRHRPSSRTSSRNFEASSPSRSTNPAPSRGSCCPSAPARAWGSCHRLKAVRSLSPW